MSKYPSEISDLMKLKDDIEKIILQGNTIVEEIKGGQSPQEEQLVSKTYN